VKLYRSKARSVEDPVRPILASVVERSRLCVTLSLTKFLCLADYLRGSSYNFAFPF